MKHRLLIADDQPLINAGISALVNAAGSFEVVGNVNDGLACLSFLDQHEVDIVLLDHQMPHLNGFETLKKIRHRNHTVRVVLVTFLAQDALLRSYMEVGLDGCLLKHDTASNLIYGLEQVAMGEVWFSTRVAQVLAGQCVADPSNGQAADALSELTRAELEVLTLIGRGLSIREISEQRGTAIKTVNHQKQCIMDKLNIHKEIKLMKFAIDHGIQ